MTEISEIVTNSRLAPIIDKPYNTGNAQIPILSLILNYMAWINPYRKPYTF